MRGSSPCCITLINSQHTIPQQLKLWKKTKQMRDCWAELRQADIKRSDSPSTMTGVDVWRSRRCLILFNTSEKWLMCDVMCWNCNGKGCDFHFPLGSSIWSKVMVLHWQEDTTLTIKIIQLQLLLNERKSIKSVSEQLSVALSQVQCLTKSETKAAESRNKHWVFVKNNYVFNRQKAQVNNNNVFLDSSDFDTANSMM